MILADKIINERKKNGWSQEELADKLGVTRQSVSKWEGAQASPDLQRILQMSELFGVSTDYLLKDNCEEVNSDNKVVADANTSAHRVSMEEANAFLDNSKESAPMYALGTSLCVCSPIALIILAGASDSGMLSISENAAGGIGVAILLTLIAIAVAIFVTTGLKGEKYDYLENEVIETEYGVEGMVKERDNKFRNRFTNMITLGVVLCILGVVTRPYIRERVVDLLTRIDPDLASGVARNLGIQLTREQLSRELPRPVCGLEQDPSLSLYAHTDGNLKGLRVSLLAADGVSLKSVKEICDALHEEGIHPQIIAPHMGSITTEEGEELFVDGTLSGTPSVLFDSVIVPEGEQSLTTLLKDGDAKYHLRQAYRHLKAIGLPGNAKAMLEAASLPQDMDDAGLLMPKDTKSLMLPFITAMKQHRVWSREPKTLDFGA